MASPNSQYGTIVYISHTVNISPFCSYSKHMRRDKFYKEILAHILIFFGDVVAPLSEKNNNYEQLM